MNKNALRKKYSEIRSAVQTHEALLAGEQIVKNCASLFPETDLNVLIYSPLKDHGEIDISKITELANENNYETAPNQKSAAFPELPYDVIIAPCIAADMNGYRLGYGGGWYDRFLEHQSGIKIYVCYESCLLPSLPHEDHDIRANYVVTEKRIIDIPVE